LDEVLAEDGDGPNGLVQEVGLERAADFFDFGEFRHAWRVGGSERMFKRWWRETSREKRAGRARCG